MLYSPILSFFRIFPLFFWTVICLTLHTMFSLISRKNFFIFYKIFFKGLVKIFGIKVKQYGAKENKNIIYISNHVSYLDVFVLGSMIDGIFVAKSEIDSWPLINKICALVKTIFIDRRDILGIKKQMNSILKSLKSGFNVIIFPEGTSSDGSRVLKFKSSLFGLVDLKTKEKFKIQPISIFYNKLDGMPVERKFRPFFAWFGNMDLLPHAWKFLGLGLSEVKVNFHKAIEFSKFKNRKEAANYCQKIISDQVAINSQAMEVDSKIKLYEFKLL